MNQITGNISVPSEDNGIQGEVVTPTGGGALQGVMSQGGVYVNDYVLRVEDFEGGQRIVITRGSEVQIVEFVNKTPESLGYVIMIDEATGERRKLRLYNGELRMGEVIAE